MPNISYHTSLAVLRKHGLYTLLPELKQPMQKCPLAIEVEAFRKKLFDKSWAMEFTPDDVQVTTALADVLMGRPSPPVARHLLCTRTRSSRDPAYAGIPTDYLAELVRTRYFDEHGRARAVVEPDSPWKIKCMESEKRELKHYHAMSRQILAEYEQLEQAASSEHAIAMKPKPKRVRFRTIEESARISRSRIDICHLL